MYSGYLTNTRIFGMEFHKVLRNFSTSYCCHKKAVFPEPFKQKKMINKLLKPILKQNVTSNMLNLQAITRKKSRKGQFLGKRRLPMINNLLLETITDLMANGAMSYEIMDYGIEITELKLTKNGDSVQIFWLCKDSDDREKVSSILRSIAPKIRHEILELRLMGHVPYIEFLKDESRSSIQILEKLFKEADYGEDYKPLNSAIHANNYPLPSKAASLKDELNRNVADVVPTDNNGQSIKMDIFGLDYEKMMNYVKMNIKKTNSSFTKLSYENESSNNDMTFRFEKTDKFAKYLIEKRKTELKSAKLQDKIKYSDKLVIDDDYQDDEYQDTYVEYDEHNSFDYQSKQ